jgi:N-acetylmuramoyl-L-alanine amidase
MGVHKSDENFEVMKTENASILLEHNHKEKYDGFDPKSPDAYIIFKLQQHASLRQSLALADKIETYIEKHSGRKSRGVKQAGFMVLWKTTMPSVLVETGFLSNAQDEKFLNSKEGQQYVAAGICEGILDYHKTSN